MYLTLNGKRIHYAVEGKGAPILFVHGWGGSMESLRPLASCFVKTHAVILLDLPGFGKSGLPDKDWGVEEYGHLLSLFIKSLHLQQINYFGHSFGGSLGIYLASAYPDLFNKLILCDASYKRSPQKKSRAASLLRRIPLPPALTLFIRKIAYRIFYPDSDALKYPALESNFRKILSFDLTPFIKKVTVPTLIVWGAKDKDTPVSFAHELHENIVKSQLVIFPDATHGLPLMHPKEVGEKVGRFL